MSRRSSTCFGKATGRPLTDYDTFEQAEDGAAYVLQKFGTEMLSYMCSQCSMWHLAPPSSTARTQTQASPYLPTTSRESRNCYGKVSGKVLKEYDTERDAKDGASYVLEKYGNQMVPYKCQDCRKWHLSPADRQTEHSFWSCSCLDQAGSPKDCYQSKEDAARRAEILMEETRQRLHIYRCPQIQSIWHLTKKDAKSFVGRRSNQCQNKQGQFRMEYECEDDALQHASEIEDRYGREVSPYECSQCLMWHVG